MLQGLTAHYLATSTYPLRPGDTCLVHAAAGGVGLLLCQIASRLGARVIGTVSTEEKARLAREAGAHEVILYTREDFQAETRRLTGGAGRAGGVRLGGADHVSQGPRLPGAARDDGAVRPVERAGGAVRSAAAQPEGLALPDAPHAGALRRHARRAAAAGRASSSAGSPTASLDVRIGLELPLDRAAEAHVELEARRTTGKVLLIP